MRKINKAVAIVAVLGMSMIVAAGCGKKETEESFEFQSRSTEAESTESNADAESEADSDTVYATIQENVFVNDGSFDPTILYEGYESYSDGEAHKVVWLRTGDGDGMVGTYKSHSYPEAGIESISIDTLTDEVVDFDSAEKLDYDFIEVGTKKHVTHDDFCADAPYETYNISEAAHAGVFIYNCFDLLRSWRVKTDTYKIDPEHIDAKSIVSAYMGFNYEKQLDAPPEDGGMSGVSVDPSKVWVKQEDDGTTDYFFLVVDASSLTINDASKSYPEGEEISQNELVRDRYLGMLCVRVNPDYDWVHCVLHLGMARNDGNGAEFPGAASNYVLRSTAKFMPFDRIEEVPLWTGSKVEPQYIREFTYKGL